MSAAGYGYTTATLTAFQKSASGWAQVFGPWTANIGESGFAAPGQKREGDGHTPSGTYGFDFFFGVDANPGVKFPWRAVTPSIVWDDDPTSPLYNQWVDENSGQNPGSNPEPMYYETPSYDYGAVIAYNTDPVVKYAGSAIFLHVSPGGPTAGCVALPTSELLDVLRWLDPSQQPLIAMGTEAYLGG